MTKDDTDDLEEIEEDSPYLDWEASATAVRKIIGSLKAMTVHEALLTLVAACDQLTRAAPHDWDTTKVKKILNDI